MDTQKIIDIVCGMEIKKDNPLSSVYNGKTYYFCNQNCKDNFNANPTTYLGINDSDNS